jgi:hypothetical protein
MHGPQREHVAMRDCEAEEDYQAAQNETLPVGRVRPFHDGPSVPGPSTLSWHRSISYPILAEQPRASHETLPCFFPSCWGLITLL